MQMMSLIWVLPLAFALAPPAVAATPDTPQVEASMVVSGNVQIDPNGLVTGYVLDHAQAIPDVAKSIIAKTIRTWTFYPVLSDGKRVAGESRMHLRLLAKPLGDQNYAVSVKGTWFGKKQQTNEQRVSAQHRRKPRYPMLARRSRAEGIVYLLIRVNRQGQAEKVAAEQVNLFQSGDSERMTRVRQAFAKASIDAAKSWTFIIPVKGPNVAKAHWDVRVPILYTFGHGANNPQKRAYGKWLAYVPGPRNIPAWDNAGHGPASSIDTLPGTGLVAAQPSRRLMPSTIGG
ncbi:MAG: energy transducer TonB [Xanthomonadales bacterium]|nr:energy transducer TonB [Xanthomonadales bacterium]